MYHHFARQDGNVQVRFIYGISCIVNMLHPVLFDRVLSSIITNLNSHFPDWRPGVSPQSPPPPPPHALWNRHPYPLPPDSLLTPRLNKMSHSLYPCLYLCSHFWPLTLDAAPGQEEELQSSAVQWGGGIWGWASWATSSPGPERSQHAQRAGACMHLSTQGLRWEPTGCT